MPKISVIEQRYVKRGSPGQAGHTVIEKKWISGGEEENVNTKKVEFSNRGGLPESGLGATPINENLCNLGSLGNSLNSGPLGSVLGPSAGTSNYSSPNAAPSHNRYSSVEPLGNVRNSQQPQSPPQPNTPLNLYESGCYLSFL